jgi:hypothetical protein
MQEVIAMAGVTNYEGFGEDWVRVNGDYNLT